MTARRMTYGGSVALGTHRRSFAIDLLPGWELRFIDDLGSAAWRLPVTLERLMERPLGTLFSEAPAALDELLVKP